MPAVTWDQRAEDLGTTFPFKRAHDEHDWPEDASHENGNYHCMCMGCGSDFIGHKRRVVCRKCAKSDEEK